MALAHLEWLDAGPDHIELTGDIGTSKFYELRVGSLGDGEISGELWSSPLVEVDRNPFDGAFPIRIPTDKLPRGALGAQLVSYRDRERNGATLSPIVRVHSGFGVAMMLTAARTRNVAFSFRERTNGHARAASVAPRGITLLLGTPLPVFGGGKQVVFSNQRDMRLPMRVDGATRIPRAILDWSLGDLRGSERLSDVGPELSLTIARERLAALPTGRDLQLDANLRWPDGSRVRTAGVSATLRLASTHILTSVEEQGERRIGLFDATRDRPYWNRFFMGPVETNAKAVRWAAELQCRYYVRAIPGQEHGRLETRIKLEEADRGDLTQKMIGAVKSGFDLAATPLNALIPILEPSSAMLTPSELDAVAGALEGRGSVQATHRVEARGRASTQMAIWALPEMEMRRVVLGEVATTDDNGQVTATTRVERRFPFAAAIRFVVVQSSSGATRAARDGLAFDGYDVTADHTVPLSPVALEPA
jgi:hypothetical protein